MTNIFYSSAAHLVKMMAIVIIITGVHFSASAQAVTKKVAIDVGENMPAKKSYVGGIIGSDETGTYIMRTYKNDTYIEHLNKSMTFDVSYEIPEDKTEYNGNEAIFNSAKLVNNKLYYIWSVVDGSNKKYLVEEVNKNSLESEGSFREIYSVASQKVGRLIKRTVYDDLEFLQSENEEHILLLTEEESKSDKSYSVVMYNSNFEQTWKGKITIPKKQENFEVRRIALENDGTIYITGRELQEKKEARKSKKEGRPTYTYFIYHFTEEGQTVTEIDLDLKDKFLIDAYAKTNPDGNIVVAGFYSETGSTSIKGVFYELINSKTEEVLMRKLSPFDKEFVTEYYSKSEKRSADRKERSRGEEPELESFDMRDLILKEDGGGTLIAEQYYVYVQTVTTTSSNGGTTTRVVYHYHYNDIIVLNFDASGNLLWKCKIPKRQHSTDDGGYYSSYCMAAIGDKLYFIYNDKAKNLALPKGKVPSTVSSWTDLNVVIAEVDVNGKLTREFLSSKEPNKITARPKISAQTGKLELLLYGEQVKSFRFFSRSRAKVYQFAKITFKE
jgi:hypothetical protein